MRESYRLQRKSRHRAILRRLRGRRNFPLSSNLLIESTAADVTAAAQIVRDSKVKA